MAKVIASAVGAPQGPCDTSAELRFHGESYGRKAPMILRDGELPIGRRFDTQALAAW
jgi:hypothetical protein